MGIDDLSGVCKSSETQTVFQRFSDSSSFEELVIQNIASSNGSCPGRYRSLNFFRIATAFSGTQYNIVLYQVIVEPGIGHFREFEPRRVHTRINSLGLFLVHKLTCGKRESVS